MITKFVRSCITNMSIVFIPVERPRVRIFQKILCLHDMFLTLQKVLANYFDRYIYYIYNPNVVLVLTILYK